MSRVGRSLAGTQASHFADSLLAVLGPLLLFGVATRLARLPLFFFAEELLIARFLARRERYRQRPDVFFDQEREARGVQRDL